MRRLRDSKKLTIEDYERIHRGEIPPEEWPAETSKIFRLKSIGAGGTSAEGDREYVFTG